MTWGSLKIPLYSYPENDKDLTEKNVQYYPYDAYFVVIYNFCTKSVSFQSVCGKLHCKCT